MSYKDTKPEFLRVWYACHRDGVERAAMRIFDGMCRGRKALILCDEIDSTSAAVLVREVLLGEGLTEPQVNQFVHVGIKNIKDSNGAEWAPRKNCYGEEQDFSLDERLDAQWLARGFGQSGFEYGSILVDGPAKHLDWFCAQCKHLDLDIYEVEWMADRAGLYRRGESETLSWRDGCMSFGQLSVERPKYLIEKLVPEKALTLIPAASYNGKTWFTVAMCDAISRGKDLWCFKGPSERVPVIYHVPEMNESLIRHYMAEVGVEDSENFLVRPMESGLWPLDDARMLESSQGRVVVLDTAGYFNPAEDSSSYQQSLRFATLVYNLMVLGGALAVIGLHHPPKYSKEESSWTLENSVLGSAGYGGILRSCLRMANLNPDLNDPNVHIYVQGLKNPGLKPFQLCGPMPLKMKVPPGESPYLSALKSGDSRFADAAVMFEKEIPQRQVAEQLSLSLGKVNKMHKEWQASKEF